MLALSQDAAEAAIGMIAIVVGFVVVGVLWWVMVGKPARDERRGGRKD